LKLTLHVNTGGVENRYGEWEPVHGIMEKQVCVDVRIADARAYEPRACTDLVQISNLTRHGGVQLGNHAAVEFASAV
jgi:hypothetical protein